MRALIAILLGSFLCLLGSCSHPAPQARSAGLDGLSEPQLVNRFGAAQHQEEYLMENAVGEFRTGLQRFFPMPQSRGVRIRELTWDFPDQHITAWLHHTNSQWVTFDSLRYQKGVQF
jgi:hypothetical protein